MWIAAEVETVGPVGRDCKTSAGILAIAPQRPDRPRRRTGMPAACRSSLPSTYIHPRNLSTAREQPVTAGRVSHGLPFGIGHDSRREFANKPGGRAPPAPAPAAAGAHFDTGPGPP